MNTIAIVYVDDYGKKHYTVIREIDLAYIRARFDKVEIIKW